MTEPTTQDDHSGCTGHIQLALIGRTTGAQTMVTHARVTLPDDVSWIPADTGQDSEETLTVRQVAVGVYVTLGNMGSRNENEVHVVLARRAHPYNTDNFHIRQLLVNYIIEEQLFVELAAKYLEQLGEDKPVTSKRVCFAEDLGNLLDFMQRSIARQGETGLFMNQALPRTYFPLGEPRPWTADVKD